MPLVGDDDGGAGLGDQEIGAGDADIGLDEAVAQLGPGLGQQVRAFVEPAVRRQAGVMLAEGVGDLLHVDVDRRRNDVARRFVAQLDDIFAEVGLDRFDNVGFEGTG